MGKKRHPNYKPQNAILNKKYACLPEVRCGFLQGREARHINKPTEKSIKLYREIPKQGSFKKYDNKDDETKEVEDKDMKGQDDIDNHNVNINCKENDNGVDCNNKIQNTIKNEVIVNNNYKEI